MEAAKENVGSRWSAVVCIGKRIIWVYYGNPHADELEGFCLII